MRLLSLAVTLLLAPPLFAQSPRRDGGALAVSASVDASPRTPPRPVAPVVPPRGSKARAAILYGSALAGGIAMVIVTKPGDGDGEPLVPALRVPLAFVAGAFIGLVASSQILRIFGD